MKSYGIRRVWQRRGLLGKLLWLLLLPISFAFLMVVTLRNALYTRKWLATRSLDRPVISIGNLSVGGTGKTPTTLWLARSLAQRGFKVGILSRGYMRKESRPIVMRYGESSPPDRLHSDDVASCGDEPAMMARLYGLTVSVTKDRYRGGLALLKQDPVDVFILDDGFQHRKLRRDFDLVLLGEDVPGWVLPCGPFRETKRSLRRADGFLITGSFEDWHKLVDTDNNNLCFEGELQPQVLLGLEANGWKEYPLTRLYRSKILAVAGIASPANFYRTIHDWDGDIVETLEFPDHHEYTTADWQHINRIARNLDLIVTTEKDIVKLTRFPFARGKLLALRVSMVVSGERQLIDAISERILRHGKGREACGG